MDSSFADDFISIVRFALLVNNLKLRKFDTSLLQKYLKRPYDGHAELDADYRNDY